MMGILKTTMDVPQNVKLSLGLIVSFLRTPTEVNVLIAFKIVKFVHKTIAKFAIILSTTCQTINLAWLNVLLATI